MKPSLSLSLSISLGVIAALSECHPSRASPRSEPVAGIALTGSIISHTPGIFVLNFASVIKAGYISAIQAGANPNEPIVWIQEEIIRMILIPVEVISNPFLLRSEFGLVRKDGLNYSRK